jgi:hypothetical protein
MSAIVILQTPVERHVENHLYGGARPGERKALCPRYFGADPECKRVAVLRIPTTAVCPECVARARHWYAPSYFEPFDRVQRRRLLANLARDLGEVDRRG